MPTCIEKTPPNLDIKGTWVPIERGIALAKQHHVDSLLRPLFDFQPQLSSPPLAPKHIAAAPLRPTKKGDGMMTTRGSKRRRRSQSGNSRGTSPLGSADRSLSSSPSRASSSSRTPSPILSTEEELMHPHRWSGALSASRPRRGKDKQSYRHNHDPRESKMTRRSPEIGEDDPSKYGDTILDYFISDTSTVPDILINPPVDFDPNMIIDEDGHTPLHWACAMGRTRVVKLLLTAGAEIFKVNKEGQTPLMRSVMFANNYDVRKFPELYELLHRSILNIDNSNKTVFHHIVGIAMGKGKPHAARYYMETVLKRLSEFPQELADILNFQDEDGETALTMAARCRSKRLVKLLIDHGADPKIRNRDGKTCEEYILEDERFRSSPIMGMERLPHTPHALHPVATLVSNPFISEATRNMASQAVTRITDTLESLATSFDQQLYEQDRDMTQARFILESAENEIVESRSALEAVKEKAEALDEAEKRLAGLRNDLLAKLTLSYHDAWKTWMSFEVTSLSSETPQPFPSDAAPDDLMVGPDSLDDSDLAQIEEYYRSPAGDMPQSPDMLEAECNALRENISRNEKMRMFKLEQLVEEQSMGGTGGKIHEYRRLLAAAMGGVTESEVDAAVGPMLESLESEPSGSLEVNNTNQSSPVDNYD